MKEIDFLPQWYRNGQRRQVSYRTQCFALGGVFVVMAVWGLVAKHSISQAEAKLAEMAVSEEQSMGVSAELSGLENELKQLRQRMDVINRAESKIDVASTLAEMSYLIDKRVVLSRVEFIAEPIVSEHKGVSASNAGTVVKPVGTAASNKEQPLSDIRFKVVIAGVAADASDVGVLMCKLEDSSYFRQVVLVFSRDVEIAVKKTVTTDAETSGSEGTPRTKAPVRDGDTSMKASEFEIQCYLANYREQ